MNQMLMLIALFGAIAIPNSSYAASLDEIVVTASRMPQALDKTLADTSVINEQDIKKSGATDVSTLLRSLPGVEVSQTGGLGGTASIFIRGTNSNQLLVLLDGVRVGSATTGATAFEHIMLDSIERIEVVRGNVSSLYGSEAIGGVIQLFTRQGRGAPTFNASAGAGSHGMQRASAGFSGEVNDTSFNVSAGKVRTEGVSAINAMQVPSANPNRNGYDNSTLAAQIKHAINGDHLLSASVFNTRSNLSWDNAFGLPTDLNNTVQNVSKFSLASDDQLSAIWHSQVKLAQGEDSSRTYGGFPSLFQTRSNQFSWQNDLKIATGQQLNFAAEHLGQAVTSDTRFTRTTRKVNSLLAGYTGEYAAQQVQLNLRQDRYSDFGTVNTGLLGYGISFADSWRVTASISNAFKAPTLNDMFFPFTDYGFGFTYAGNPNLKPERSQNREVGLHYAANGQRVDALYFDNKISDLIAMNAAFNSVTNVNQARIDGVELSYAGDFGNKHLKASVTLQNPRDTATGQQLIRRAREFASVSGSHDFGEWNMGAELRHSGARRDREPFTGADASLPSYQLLNLTARYQIEESLSVSARVDNLFNRNYSEAYSFNTLGRTLFVGLTYQQ